MDTITVDLKRAKRSLILRTILGWVCFLLTFGFYVFCYVFRIIRDNNVLMAIVVVASVILGLDLIATLRLPKCLKNALRSVSADGNVIIINENRFDMVQGAGFNVYDGPLKLRFLYGFSLVAVQTNEKGKPSTKSYWCGFWSDDYCREKITEIISKLGDKLTLIRDAKWDKIGENLSTTPFEFSSQRKPVTQARVNNALIGFVYAVVVLGISAYEFWNKEVFLGVVLIVIALYFIVFVAFNQYLYSVNLKMLIHDVYLSETEYRINGYSYAIGSIKDVYVYMASKKNMDLRGNIEVCPPEANTDSGFYMDIVLDSGAKSRYWFGPYVDTEVSKIMGSAEYVRKMRRAESVR